jgi:acyl-CoA reductase-like NAD-dependent aldehyde dehydrogenase
MHLQQDTQGQLLIAGQWIDGRIAESLCHRYDLTPIGRMQVADVAQVGEAVTAAVAAFEASTLSPSDRYRILSRAADLVQQRQATLMAMVSAETGFPAVDARNEVARTVQTLRLCAEEAHRITGEIVPMQATPGLTDRMGYTVLVPLGVVCVITPFNSPLNVVAHKLGPALAAGNAVIFKPSEHVPLCAVALCQLLIEAGLPPGLISLLHGGPEIGRALVADPRIAFYAFTGSTRVGREIQAGAGLRRTQLELGSIASTIVCADANLPRAVSKCVQAAFRKAGQVCTSVQRLYVQRDVAAEFTELLVAAARQVRYGDPSDPETVVGPMISLAHAQRAEAWIREAVTEGAELLCGGTRDGAVLAPTVLSRVGPGMRVMREEIFAPVLSLSTFDSLDEAYDAANDTPFGLAVGLFTSDLSIAMRAGRRLRFGGVHINETSSSRVDVMPFGGVKDSGFGREGPHYAVREMMEARLVTIAY